MKVKMITRTEDLIERYDGRDSIDILINDELCFSVCDDEPEDSNLSRSFSQCYSITELMEAAYIAGTKGEEFEVLFEESDSL